MSKKEDKLVTALWDAFELGNKYGTGLEYGDGRSWEDYKKLMEEILEKLKFYQES